MRELTKFMLARPYSTSALATRNLSDLLTKLESMPQTSVEARITVTNGFRDAIEASCNINHIPTMLHELSKVSDLVRGTHTAMDQQSQKQFEALNLMLKYAKQNLERKLRDHKDNVVTPPAGKVTFGHQ